MTAEPGSKPGAGSRDALRRALPRRHGDTGHGESEPAEDTRPAETPNHGNRRRERARTEGTSTKHETKLRKKTRRSKKKAKKNTRNTQKTNKKDKAREPRPTRKATEPRKPHRAETSGDDTPHRSGRAGRDPTTAEARPRRQAGRNGGTRRAREEDTPHPRQTHKHPPYKKKRFLGCAAGGAERPRHQNARPRLAYSIF